MAMENTSDAQITAALEQVARDPEERTFLILHGDAYRNYYLQFARVNGMLHCEAVANEHLKRPDQLDAQHTAMLERLGWSAPGEGIANWYREVEPGSEAEVVAHARSTFTDAYGLPEGAPLAMEGGSS